MAKGPSDIVAEGIERWIKAHKPCLTLEALADLQVELAKACSEYGESVKREERRRADFHPSLDG